MLGWGWGKPRALDDYLNLFPDDVSSFLRRAERERSVRLTETPEGEGVLGTL